MHLSPELKRCIEHCNHCYETCLHSASTHCLEMGGEHARPEHIKLMLDCADICRTSADFMLRHSPRHEKICGVCAEICEACADDCERVGGMEECVKACRQCAESCRQMSAAHA